MKTFFMVIAASAALSAAGTANAQYQGQYDRGYGQNNDWNYQRGGFSQFEQDYRHTVEGIRHGLRDGTFSRSRADGFYRELQSIRREAYRSQQYGNYRNNYIQARMARLHTRMHTKHERSHERNERYGTYDRGYGGYQPGYGGYNRGNDHDDHDDDD